MGFIKMKILLLGKGGQVGWELQRSLAPLGTLVALDFERDDLIPTLVEHGYQTSFRTFFVWEGVTQYLTEPAVRATLAALRTAAPGSRPSSPPARPSSGRRPRRPASR